MNPARLEQLIERHSAALAIYAANWTIAADDAVQEAFIALLKTVPEPPAPLPWLYTAVRRSALMMRRGDDRRRRRERLAARLGSTAEAGFDRFDLADTLSQLPDQEREIVLAHVWGQLTFADIAELTGLSAPTAFRRYRDALGKLRPLLEPARTATDNKTTAAHSEGNE